MPSEGSTPERTADNLLQDDEPIAFRVLNGSSTRPLLIVCDHASRRFPAAIGDLGLDEVALRCHLAWDIGAGSVSRKLARSLEATAVLAEYSRLVVDCNRHLMDPSAFLEFGDGVVIHGNRGLSQEEKDRRAREIYWPYHYAVDVELKRLSKADCPPLVVAIHSFTPVLNGVSRAWDAGVLWDADRPTAEHFIAGLRRHGLNVGDNEPYSGKAPADFTIDHHAEAAGLPHVGIEIRHDLIADDQGAGRLADIFAGIIEALPATRAKQAPGEQSSLSL